MPVIVLPDAGTKNVFTKGAGNDAMTGLVRRCLRFRARVKTVLGDYPCCRCNHVE
jgi:hypothetical protein